MSVKVGDKVRLIGDGSFDYGDHTGVIESIESSWVFWNVIVRLDNGFKASVDKDEVEVLP